MEGAGDQKENAQELAQDAINKLSLVIGDPEEPALSNRLQAAISRISPFPQKNSGTGARRKARRPRLKKKGGISSRFSPHQSQLRASLNSGTIQME